MRHLRAPFALAALAFALASCTSQPRRTPLRTYLRPASPATLADLRTEARTMSQATQGVIFAGTGAVATNGR